jgi:hypothetical protein
MSYFASSFNRRSQPYIESDVNAKVPGWGMNLEHAGPPMIAVGASPDGLGATKLRIAPAVFQSQAAQCAIAFAQEKTCATPGSKIAADVCGRAVSKAYDCRVAANPPPADQTAPGVSEDPMSYWIWIASGGIILGAIGLFAYNQGWIGGKKTATATTNKRRRH